MRVLLSVSVLVALAVLQYISRDIVREAGRPLASASSLPGPVESGAPGAFRNRRLVGQGEHEALIDDNEAKDILKILDKLDPDDTKRLANTLTKAAGKGETNEGVDSFMGFQCPDSWTGWLLCNGEKWVSWTVSYVVINPVAYPMALILLLILITFGQCNEFGVEHQRWAKWFSAIVVANIFFNHDSVEFMRKIIGHNTVFVTLAFSAVTSLAHARTARTATAIAVRQEVMDKATNRLRAAEKSHIFLCSEDVHVPALEGPTDMIVGNKYMLLTKNFFSVCLTFFVQTSLFLFFLYEVHENEKLHRHDMRTSYFRWLVAVGIVNVVSDDQMGGEYDAAFWRLALSVRVQVSKEGQSEGEEVVELAGLPSHQSGRCISLSTEWRLRNYMSFMVNGVFRAIILCMAPILLSQAGPMEFIKDCLAVFFVTALDDLQEKKSMIREIAFASKDVCEEVDEWTKEQTYRPTKATGGIVTSSTVATS